jgi:hypothetical protein
MSHMTRQDQVVAPAASRRSTSASTSRTVACVGDDRAVEAQLQPVAGGDPGRVREHLPHSWPPNRVAIASINGPGDPLAAGRADEIGEFQTVAPTRTASDT